MHAAIHDAGQGSGNETVKQHRARQGSGHETEKQLKARQGSGHETEKQLKARFASGHDTEKQLRAQQAPFPAGKGGKTQLGQGAGTKHAKPADRAQMLVAHGYDTLFDSAKEAGKACRITENIYRVEKGVPKSTSTFQHTVSLNVFKEHCKLVQGMVEDEDENEDEAEAEDVWGYISN